MDFKLMYSYFNIQVQLTFIDSQNLRDDLRSKGFNRL